jgi:hypothetical protein
MQAQLETAIEKCNSESANSVFVTNAAKLVQYLAHLQNNHPCEIVKISETPRVDCDHINPTIRDKSIACFQCGLKLKTHSVRIFALSYFYFRLEPNSQTERHLLSLICRKVESNCRKKEFGDQFTLCGDLFGIYPDEFTSTFDDICDWKHVMKHCMLPHPLKRIIADYCCCHADVLSFQKIQTFFTPGCSYTCFKIGAQRNIGKNKKKSAQMYCWEKEDVFEKLIQSHPDGFFIRKNLPWFFCDAQHLWDCICFVPRSFPYWVPSSDTSFYGFPEKGLLQTS